MKKSKPEHPSYKETRWHLLRVEKNGSLKPFVHFRGVVMIVAGLILVMTGAVGWLLIEWLEHWGVGPHEIPIIADDSVFAHQGSERGSTAGDFRHAGVRL